MTILRSYFGTFANQATISFRRENPDLLLNKNLQRALLAIGDSVTVGAITAIGVRATVNSEKFNNSLNRNLSVEISILAVVICFFWIGIINLFGTYQLRHQRSGATEYKRVALASFTMAGIVGICNYLVNFEFPRELFAAMFVLGTWCLLLIRIARRKTMEAVHRRGKMLTPVIVVGESGNIDDISTALKRENWLGYKLVGAISQLNAPITPSGIPILGEIANTVSIISENKIATVIFTEGSFKSSSGFRRMTWELEKQNVHMIVVPTLSEISSRRIDVRQVAGLPLLDVGLPRAIAAGHLAKRTFDVFGAFLILLFVAPIIGFTALAIKLDDGGPILFKQFRVGKGGKIFEILKLRTMVLNSEQKLKSLVETNEGSGPLFKMAADPRITKLGSFLRKYSIDELPQLWNVLLGDMSLVGPRPGLPSEVEEYDFDARRRLEVRPGLTGLWQVSGRSNLSWEDTVRLDLYYVDNWSFSQDLIIFIRTIKAVLGARGAY